MKTMVRHTIACVLEQLRTSTGYFQLLAFDFALDASLKPFLCEVRLSLSHERGGEAGRISSALDRRCTATLRSAPMRRH